MSSSLFFLCTVAYAYDGFLAGVLTAPESFFKGNSLRLQIVTNYIESTLDSMKWMLFVSGTCEEPMRQWPFVDCIEIPWQLESIAFRAPYVDWLLRTARQRARSRYLLYSNFGIVVRGDVIATIKNSVQQVREPHVFISANPIALWPRKVYKWNATEELVEHIRETGRTYEFPGWACEWFVINRANPIFRRIPPFLIGRPRWDNWVMQFSILHDKVAPLDVSSQLDVLHLEHGESAEAAKDIKSMTVTGWEYNHHVGVDSGGHTYGNFACFPYKLDSIGIVVNQSSLCRGLPWFNQQNFDYQRARTNFL